LVENKKRAKKRASEDFLERRNGLSAFTSRPSSQKGLSLVRQFSLLSEKAKKKGFIFFVACAITYLLYNVTNR
jgi:hypothetical protein